MLPFDGSVTTTAIGSYSESYSRDHGARASPPQAITCAASYPNFADTSPTYGPMKPVGAR